MGNCLKSFGKKKKNVSVLIVGLDNAGKTTAAKRVQGASIENVAPTVGYSSDLFKFGNFDVTMIDVGGGKRIRDIWKNYFAEVHAVIYVVDSSDLERIEESRNELSQLLSNPLISEKPLLLFANKQDKEGALDEVDIGDRLNLEAIVNRHKSFCKVETCAAVLHKKDRAIKSGMTWLLSMVEKDYAKIDARVQSDVEQRDAELEVEMNARRERIRKRREEREAQEKANQVSVNDQNSADSGDAPGNYTNNATGASDPSNLKHITPSNTPGNSARSGLGDELMDDDTDISLPGSVDQPRVHCHDNANSEIPWNNNSRISDVVRDSPYGNSSATDEAMSSNSEKDGTTPSKMRKKSKRSNKILPLADNMEHPNATVLAPLKVNGKLTPLDFGENANMAFGEENSGKLGAIRLPPLKLSKPNVDTDDDIVV